jgi:hypothetical protein
MFFNDLHENEEGRLNGRKKVAPSLTPSSVTHYYGMENSLAKMHDI